MTAPDPAWDSINGPRTPEQLDQALRGALPCIGCGYELQGLSVRGQCPECGTAVRATILYAVDPEADAFQPMARPRLVGAAIVLWPLAAFIAVVLMWLPRLADASQQSLARAIFPEQVGVAPAIALLVSGVAALALVRPVRETSRRDAVLARIAILAYIPLAALVWHVHVRLDPLQAAPYFNSPPRPERIVMRLAIAALALVILLGLRPNARRLAARSLVLRTGRVDRQTIAATVAAMLLAALGDGVRLLSLNCPDAVATHVAGAGSLLVLIGSMLVTLAIAGAVVDGWRIRRAIVRPSPSLRQVLGDA